MKQSTILFYDGECSFCNKTVNWVIKRNKKANLFFAPLQGETAKALLYNKLHVNHTIDSLILYENEKVYIYSDAALNVAKHLDGMWKLTYSFRIIPTFIRNTFYKGFAKRRYKWFGKEEMCQIPDSQTRKRFLD